jgi:hypothetical protein
MAGAFRGAYINPGAATGLTRTNTTGVFGTGARLGGVAVNQFAGLNANFNLKFLSKFNVNASYLTFGGASQAPGAGVVPQNFDTTNVLGADISTRTLGVNLMVHYAKADTKLGSKSVTTKNNEAIDASAQLSRGSLSLMGGYRNVGPYFGAPGAWARVGSFQNPTDIKGAYGKLSYNLSNRIQLMGSAQNYQGTGKVLGQLGGLGTNDKINNLGLGVKVQITGPSSLEVTSESTEYTVGTGASALSVGKPKEQFTTVGYKYDFNPASAFRLLYQIADYNGKNNVTFNNGLGNIQKGGVVTGQFSVRF